MLRLAILILAPSFAIAADGPTQARRFDFGGRAPAGSTSVGPSIAFDPARGFGFEPNSKLNAVDRGGDDPNRDGFVTADGPFAFSVALPEGNYDVTVTLGDRDGESTTTVKSESRRLMLEAVRTEKGAYADRTFTVNVRTDRIASGDRVRLKARERDVLHWDGKLTIEFGDARPCVDSIEIVPNDKAATVYLAGDSTVTDQPDEPWNSWGQMLPRFFRPGVVAVANHAESGESLKSFEGERRLAKVLSAIRAGDYLLIQFGHNDQKDRAEGAGAFTTYQGALARFIAETRSKGAFPVLVTPVNRRTFGPDGKITNSLGDFPEAVRRVAREANVPLIDLNAMSKPFYEALGPEGSKAAFVDNTHHNAYGSYELARCVVEGIRKSAPDLAKLLDDSPPFDPSKPDPLTTFRIPASPKRAAKPPDGN